MKVPEIFTVFFLLTNSWLDWKKRQISLWLTGIFALTGLLYSFLCGRRLEDFLVPVGFGLLFLALSILSRGAMGMGDGWLLLALGMMLNTAQYLRTLFSGMILAAVWSAILLALFKKNRRTEIPLIPFISLSYIGGNLIWR